MADKNDKLQYTQYKYRIEWAYNAKHESEVYKLLPSQVTYIIIDRYYDGLNMPTILMACSIDRNMLDKMIKYQNTDTFTMILYKFPILDDENGTEIKYIKDEFIYFINTDDPNYNKEIDYNAEDADRTDIFIKTSIGLMSYRMINDNKKISYGAFNGSIVNGTRINKFNQIDVIHHYTKHMKMLIEPMKAVPLNQEMMIPVDTVSKIIEQIDGYKTFYETPYRFFIDFDRTYLLSSSGEEVPAIGEDITTIICNILDVHVPEDQGIAVDAKNNCYIFNINSRFTAVDDVRLTNKINTKIDMVVGNGDLYDKNKLSLSENDSLKEKTSMLIRVKNENDGKVQLTKSSYDNNQNTIIIKKSHIDCDAFKINKSFNINNYSQLKDLDGKYLISRNQEIYSFEENELVLQSVLYLRKIN
jgi:hypothetical protein